MSMLPFAVESTAGLVRLCGLDGHKVVHLVDHPADRRGVFQFANLVALSETEAVEDFTLMAIGLGATAMKSDCDLRHL